MTTTKNILNELKNLGRPDALPFLAKYGINAQKAFGVPLPGLRKFAKVIGKDHNLALQLWDTEIHDARLLASMIAEPDKTTKTDMNYWAKNFYSWDVCDQFCNNLFVYTPYAYDKAIEWSKKKPEYFKRAGFVLMATSAVHKKDWNDEMFHTFFSIIKKESTDERNFVKKAVNWALRQIGKRNIELNKKAVQIAYDIGDMDSKSAKWIAKDALRELTSDAVSERLKKKV